MSWRKAELLSHHANSDKNKILRLLYAKELVKCYNSGVEVWNIDESAIVSTDARSRGWFWRWETGHITGRILPKRVSLLAAVSSRGRVMHCALNRTFNSDGFILVFSKMLELLEEEDNNYLDKNIFVLDNAPYHRSKIALSYLQSTGARICFSAPYSMCLAPAEKLF